MVDVSDAIVRARTYLTVIMPEYVELQPKVEEMELSDDQSKWEITFSAEPIGKPKADSLADLFRPQTIQKVVAVRADDGSLIAVTNRVR
jgi:hypothetical protein